LQSRALAGTSQQMREKLKAAYSLNDFDQLSKQAAAENKLLFKQQHYVNPGTASTITLGWIGLLLGVYILCVSEKNGHVYYAS